MANEVKTIRYKIKQYESVKKNILNDALEKIKNIGGILDAKFDDEDGSLVYIISDNIGDYEIFSSLMSVLDNADINLVFDEEIKQNEHGAEGEVAAETDKDEEEDDKITKAKKEKKDEKIENIVILSLSAVLMALGFIFEKSSSKASMWIYMFGYALAGYETLYSLISDIAEKRYPGEKVMILVSSFVALYFGFRLFGCVLIFAYSLISCLYSVFGNVSIKLEELGFSEEEIKSYNEKTIVDDKKVFIYDMILLAVALVATFVPPFFNINLYWSSLTQKWLCIGICIISFGLIGNLSRSVAKNYAFSRINAAMKGAKIYDDKSFDELAEAKKFLFDKTGVITNENGKVVKVETSDEKLLAKYVVSVESDLLDPIARTLAEYFAGGEKVSTEQTEFIEGKGVVSQIGGKKIVIGSDKLLKKYGLNVGEAHGTVVYVAEDNRMLGKIYLDFDIRDDAYGAVAELREDLSIQSELISSDSMENVKAINEEVGFAGAVSGASVEYKAEKSNESGIFYVGNAYAHGKTLKKAEHSIVFGADKTESEGQIFVENSDIKLVPKMVKIAKRNSKILKQNKILWLVFKLLFLALGVVLSLTVGYRYSMLIAACGASIGELIVFINTCRNLTEAV